MDLWAEKKATYPALELKKTVQGRTCRPKKLDRSDLVLKSSTGPDLWPKNSQQVWTCGQKNRDSFRAKKKKSDRYGPFFAYSVFTG